MRLIFYTMYFEGSMVLLSSETLFLHAVYRLNIAKKVQALKIIMLNDRYSVTREKKNASERGRHSMENGIQVLFDYKFVNRCSQICLNMH
jgi:hypothetical protein